jgi:hypothetical protein
VPSYPEVPPGWTVVRRRRIGPFVTHVTYRRADGGTTEWRSCGRGPGGAWAAEAAAHPRVRARPHRLVGDDGPAGGHAAVNLSTYDALRTGLSTAAENRVIWAPDALGCVAFLVASALAWVEVCGGLLGSRG